MARSVGEEFSSRLTDASGYHVPGMAESRLESDRLAPPRKALLQDAWLLMHGVATFDPPFWFNAALALGMPLAFVAGALSLVRCGAHGFAREHGLRLGIKTSMILVAVFGLALGTARWWIHYNYATVYAPEYRETRFRLVRVGMTRYEVESILGRPIQIETETPDRPFDGIWKYSTPPPPGTWGDNFWRRWVLLNEGRVVAIIDD